MHNVGCRIRSSPRNAPRLAALAVPHAWSLTGMATAGTAQEAEDASASGSASRTESPTADVSVPEGVAVTAQGTDLDVRRQRGRRLRARPEPLHAARPHRHQGSARAASTTSRASSSTTPTSARPTTTTSTSPSRTSARATSAARRCRCGASTATTPCCRRELHDRVQEVRVHAAAEEVRDRPAWTPPGLPLAREGHLESRSFRPDQAFDPIEWTGGSSRPRTSPRRTEDKKENKGERATQGDGPSRSSRNDRSTPAVASVGRSARTPLRSATPWLRSAHALHPAPGPAVTRPLPRVAARDGPATSTPRPATAPADLADRAR